MTDNEQPVNAQPINFGVPTDVQTTSLIGYQSRGHCLVIAEQECGLEICASLQTAAKTLLVPDPVAETIDKQATDDAIRVIRARVVSLAGYLGAFDCLVGRNLIPDHWPK